MNRVLLTGFESFHKASSNPTQEIVRILETENIPNVTTATLPVEFGRSGFIACQLIDEFKPDLVLIDRQRHFGIAALKKHLPLVIFLRGDYWSELQWVKQTTKNPQKYFEVLTKEKIADKCFRNTALILPICISKTFICNFLFC